jgi:lysylphosphatidylglycerol synthetase-like protein (DUF2156 family)
MMAANDKVVLARLVLLAAADSDDALKRAIVLHSDPAFAETVVAIVANVLTKLVTIEAEQIAALRPFRRAIHRLAAEKGQRGDKRRLLSQKRLLAAASAVVDIVLPQLETEEWSNSSHRPPIPKPVESITWSPEQA